MSQTPKIAILGAGESGVGSAVLAASKGYDVLVSDLGTIKPKYKQMLIDRKINFEENKHDEAWILSAEEVIKSPGIPDKAPLIIKLREKGIAVISEIEFAARYTKATLIGISGTNGKTTTTLLTYHLLKKGGINVGLAGNVGKSFALQVAENDFDYFVLELSSFQLDGMYHVRLNIAVLLNITPDHLDRYNYELQHYVNAKFRIIQNQTEADCFIYCHDDELLMKHFNSFHTAAKLLPFSLQTHFDEGGYIENENLIINYNHNTFSMSIHDLALQGKHNQYNSMAASLSARVLEVRKEIIRESLEDFVNVEHRLEFVAKVHGIEFINDSKATNVNSTWYALESMNNPVVWIVGGQDKGNDYSMLMALVKDKVKAIVCLGKDNTKIHQAFKGVVTLIEDASTAEEAVKKAYRLGKKGDIVLLSPACASFDLFENYEDRGHQFKQAVRSL
jgi:UDP-N-acetylmuramoylalanine--D-glutamate ligase